MKFDDKAIIRWGIIVAQIFAFSLFGIIFNGLKEYHVQDANNF